ncbi:xanthine dehydrogenase family protein subunit M [Halobellus sp. Atlit-38R]|jgi:carbon-monoxide dehydrogenase medium subunit|uniref:FAD binding domain-containing protein n=1 Tax=Halobellus sp. Atlit-38R TaxID=2282131 RepID=UPI000EF1CEDD|nr:xanthine dehydrogenase family protein subunit M [Halobellus sp. Atlit-38R]RLM94679.1 xanthine dehydrogenase family protein subunit M [Halobellus sp. Atlit-38R]
MKAAPFEHHEPTSLSKAVSLLESLDNPTILAGGQSLVPMLRFRLARPDTVVDINGIDELDYLDESDGYLKIGALARHADIEESDVVTEDYGSFADAAPLVADPQIRNRGTIVGSIAQADPKGDWGSVLIAHDGEVVAEGPEGERVIPVDELFLLPYDTSLDENELITEARLPTPAEREGSAYHKLKRKTGDYAMAGVAARLRFDDDGTIADAGIGMTAVDITNARAADAEAHLEGERPSAELFQKAGELAAEQSNPESDEHGDASYKERMVNVLTQRALGDAAERAGVVKRRATP